MNRNEHYPVDIAFLGILLLFFGGTLFFALDTDHITQNGIIFCGAAVVLLITYFTTLKTGLLSAVAVLFLLAAYTLFSCTLTGEAIPLYVYFWIVWLPLIALSFSMFTRNTAQLKDENRDLSERINVLSMLDDTTRLKNLRFFEKDAKRFMYISSQYHIPLHMLVWELEHEPEVLSVNGENIMLHVSKTIADSVGEEGEVYLLKQSPNLWGTLVFCDREKAGRIAQAVQENVSGGQAERRSVRKVKNSLMMHCGVVNYDGRSMSAFALLQNAQDTMKPEKVPEEAAPVQYRAAYHRGIPM